MVAAYGNMLQDRGHDVTIVLLRSRRSWRPGALLSRAVGGFCVWTGFRRDHLHDFRGDLRSALAEHLASVVPQGDVIVATHWVTAQPVLDLSDDCGTKCYFIQGYETHAFRASDIERTWEPPMQKLVVSSWLRDLISRRRPEDPSPSLCLMA